MSRQTEHFDDRPADLGGRGENRARLVIRLFGGFEATVNGNPLPALRSYKGRWLLALLALRRGRAVERLWLAGTLWPDTTDDVALATLRRTLSDVRRALGPAAERISSPSRTSLRMDLDPADLDVAAFEACLARGGETDLAEAVALYRGPLLEGCAEEWVLQERAVRELACLDALGKLAAHAAVRREFDRAADFLRQVVAVDPLRECDQRLLMKMLAECGDHSAAVQVYRDLRLLLRSRLNTEPDPETQSAYDKIRAGARRRPPAAVTGMPPPVALAGAARGLGVNLPHPLTGLIGRESELSGVLARLRVSRLVTLTGPGGVGKTRLAIEAARRAADVFSDGVLFVELAAVNDRGLVPQAVASALGIHEVGGEALTDTIARSLRHMQALIVLDNCEHLVAACAELAHRLLAGCADLRVVATSRQPLGLPGEVDWRVPPLALAPEPGATSAPAGAQRVTSEYADSAAVRLFVERAAAARTGFTLAEANVASVAAICRRLDGIPLAIELAAARAKHLTVHDIENRLGDRMSLAGSPNMVAAPRQHTLRGVIEWSYNLLDAAEKALLRRLSVFANTFDADSVRAVCCDDVVPHNRVEELVGSLVDKSLVALLESEGTSRYRLLDTTREFARARLGEELREGWLAARHVEYVLDVVERARSIRNAGEDAASMAAIDEVEPDLRAALEWCSLPGADNRLIERFVSVAGLLGVYWSLRGRISEGSQHLARLRERVPNGTAACAALLVYGAELTSYSDTAATSRSLAEQALAIYEELGDVAGAARSSSLLGAAQTHLGEAAAAVPILRGALETYTKLGDPRGRIMVLTFLGVALYAMGDLTGSRACHEECLTLCRAAGPPRTVPWAVGNLADVALAENDPDTAVALYRESIAGFVRLQHPGGISECLRGLAQAAAIRATNSSFLIAAELFGAAEATRSGLGPIPSMFAAQHRNAVERVRLALGNDAFEAAFTRGGAMSGEEAVARAEYI